VEAPKLKVGEKVITYVMILISLFILYHAYKISGQKTTAGSPGAFPLMTSLALVVFSVWTWGENRKFSPGLHKSLKSRIGALQEIGFSGDCLLVILFVLVYAFMLKFLGFSIATVIFLWGSMCYLTKGNWGKNLLIALFNLAIILLIFKQIFKVILP
jgi:hypothetical protein